MHLEDNVLTLQPCEEPAVTWTMGKVKAGCFGKAAPTPPPPPPSLSPSALLHHRSFSLPPSFLLSTSHAVSPSISFAQVLKHLQIPFML